MLICNSDLWSFSLWTLDQVANNKLPPEFDPLLAELAEQPEHVREMFRYALVLVMVDDEKAEEE